MGDGQRRADEKDRYVAVIDQDQVTDEVRDVAVNYDPLNRSSGPQGFHVTDDGELRIDDEFVMAEHRLIEKKIPNDAVRILQLPAERGELVHQYGENGFRLYELPAPSEGQVVGLLGPNGVGKTTALRVLAGDLRPNLGDHADPPDWDEVVRRFRGTGVQSHLEALRDGTITTARKPQRVDRLAELFEAASADDASGAEDDAAGAEGDAAGDEDDPARDEDEATGADDGVAGDEGAPTATVADLVAARDERGLREDALAALDLEHLAERELADCSGGERQRAAIAATLVADADLYLLDEPSSFLDVGQRLSAARAIGELAGDRAALVVDHDLVTLDALADAVHVCYGEPGGFGVVSRPLTARRGINQFLAGELEAEATRIRETAIDFVRRSRRRDPEGEPVVAFPALEATLGAFELSVEPGAIFPGQVLGVLGRNGLGKTTFAKLLAGAIEPDAGDLDADVRVSYKPQRLSPDFDGTVEALFAARADARDRRFRRAVRDPLDLEALYEREVRELSGGELQRVGIGLALAREADCYLLDEPSAFLDVERRTEFAATLRGFVDEADAACLLVDHDLMLLDYVSDRAMAFEGEPGERGVGRSPEPVRDGIDRFLRDVGVTFRRDPDTDRPRANKPGSQKDRAQRSEGEFFAT